MPMNMVSTNRRSATGCGRIDGPADNDQERYQLMAGATAIVHEIQALFGTTTIGVTMWGRLVLVASSVLIMVELEKTVIWRIDRNR